MVQDRAIDLNIMHHLFFDLRYKENKRLTQSGLRRLNRLIKTYKSVIDEVASNPDSFLVLDHAWHGLDATTNPKLREAWHDVSNYAVSRMGVERVRIGVPYGYRSTAPFGYYLNPKLADFVRKGGKVRITDCGEYLGVCPSDLARSLADVLRANGVDAVHAASRLAGMRPPELTGRQRARAVDNINAGRYQFWGLPKPKEYALGKKSRGSSR